MESGEKFLLAAAALAIAGMASASGTIAYSHDSRGRLMKVERNGGVNDNVVAHYACDKADNRTNVDVVSPNPPPK
jgi:hypothetical protein